MKLADLHENKSKSQFYETREQVAYWLKEYGVRGWTIHDDLTVDCAGSVDISGRQLLERFPVQFGKIAGEFNCKGCTALESLIGAPKSIGMNFDIGGCLALKNLEGCPQEIKESFDATYCTGLISLKGMPPKIGGYVCLNHCDNLKSLEGISETIGTDLYLGNCLGLTSLKDIHKYVKHIAIENRNDDGEILMRDTNIKSHVLGVLKIEGVASIELDNKEVEEIINKYLPMGDMLACIDELQDAGFEEFAKL